MWIRVGSAVWVAIALSLVACAPGEPVERPLLDGLHEPEVLTEVARLELPPSLGANRFVRGWHPWTRSGQKALVPGAGEAVFELANLKQRARRLTVRFAVFDPRPGRETRVCVNGVELASVPLTNPLTIDLPAELPLGRVALALNCGGNPEPPGDREASLAVTAALVRPALPPGGVVFESGRVVQAPWSAVDFVRRISSPSRLRGRFRPPVQGGTGAGYSISAEWRDGGQEPLYAWPGAGEEIDVDLGDRTGLLRLRLTARGEGAAGRWEDLRLVSRERAPEPARPPPPAPRLVVLYVLDALRADALGHLGGVDGVSPTIDRLAAEGVTFSDHFSVAPNTMPSMKALFIGRAFRTKGGWKLPPEDGSTLAEAWAAAGYRTAAFSANAFVSHEFGLARGFELAPEKVGAVGTDRVPSARRVHRFGLEWLDLLEPDENVLLYLHTVHPHNPYDPPEPFRSRFTAGIESEIDGSSRTLIDIKHQRIAASPADRERLKGLYRGGLAYNDAELAKLLEILEERYAPGEMLFVITSDHGEELFEHGGVLHGYTLYDEQLHIPLIFWWPGVLEPFVVDRPTDALDLHTTLRALIDPGGVHDAEGESLWPLLTGGEWSTPKAVRFAAASSLRTGIFMARSDHAKFIWAPRWGMGEGLGRTRDAVYLFDLESDPGEMENLAGGPGLEAAWLRSQLRAWIEREKLIDLESASPDEIDDETRRRLRALGYLD